MCILDWRVNQSRTYILRDALILGTTSRPIFDTRTHFRLVVGTGLDIRDKLILG